MPSEALVVASSQHCPALSLLNRSAPNTSASLLDVVSACQDVKALTHKLKSRTNGTHLPSKMRPPSSVLTFSLLHGVGFVTGHWETGLDGDLYGEIPRPTNQPLLYRGLNHGAVLMETGLGYPRNGTTRRDLALGARQVYDTLEVQI